MFLQSKPTSTFLMISWINLDFWETSHLPLSFSLRSANVFPVVASLLFGGREVTTGNTLALRRLPSLKLTCWLSGVVGWQFPANLNWSDIFLVRDTLAWKNSRHFATPSPVSPRNDVWAATVEIPYWRRPSQSSTYINPLFSNQLPRNKISSECK